jgi:hypothetical protein
MTDFLVLDNKLGRSNLTDHDLQMIDQHATDRSNPWLTAVLEELQTGRDYARQEERDIEGDSDSTPGQPKVLF